MFNWLFKNRKKMQYEIDLLKKQVSNLENRIKNQTEFISNESTRNNGRINELYRQIIELRRDFKMEEVL
jgi:polyhydroxyalkanoate synthesis regulator phasin